MGVSSQIISLIEITRAVGTAIHEKKTLGFSTQIISLSLDKVDEEGIKM
jgi:hypothetical protein